MSMFCFQCQETAKNQGCTVRGVCGKEEETAKLQDLLVFNLKGISFLAEEKINKGEDISALGRFICDCLFATITNANFDNTRIIELNKEAVKIKKELIEDIKLTNAPLAATWIESNDTLFLETASKVGVLSTEDEDVRSLRELNLWT